MSNSDYILFHTDLSAAEASERLASALGLSRVLDDAGRVFVVDEAPSPGVRQIGGPVSESAFHTLLAEPEDEWSVMDGFTLDWDIDTSPRVAEERRHLESRALFRRVVAAVDWPSVLLLNGQLLMAASRPATGLVEFDPPVSPDGDNRDQWAAFDVAERKIG